MDSNAPRNAESPGSSVKQISNWYYCDVCKEIVDPIVGNHCAKCGHEVEIRSN